MSTPEGVYKKKQCKEKIIVGNILSEFSEGYSTDAISCHFFTDDLEENVESPIIRSAYQKTTA